MWNQISKFSTVAIACLFLAACQTAGLKPGSLTTSYAPAGWIKKTNGTTTIYACPSTRCKSPQLVAIGPQRVKGNAEAAIRANILSSGLLKEVGNSASRATGGKFKLLSSKRIVADNYSGFEITVRLTEKSGRNVYFAARTVIQEDRGSEIMSIASSLKTAKANLRNILRQTSIRRIP